MSKEPVEPVVEHTPKQDSGHSIPGPIRAVNPGVPKIRLEDASGDTIAFVYYPASDYDNARTVGNSLATYRAEELVKRFNSHDALTAQVKQMREALESIAAMRKMGLSNATACFNIADAALSQGKGRG